VPDVLPLRALQHAGELRMIPERRLERRVVGRRLALRFGRVADIHSRVNSACPSASFCFSV
jgi:hypothetical protein